MEPFGLFQFLQSLLNSPVSAPQDTEEITQPQPQETPTKPVQNTENKDNDTYLKFITAHEARIQKTRT